MRIKSPLYLFKVKVIICVCVNFADHGVTYLPVLHFALDSRNVSVHTFSFAVKFLNYCNHQTKRNGS